MRLLGRSWGPPDTNPRTGLPEYGWFDSVLGAALPALGAVFPGVGGDIGSFLGAEGPWSSVLGNAILGGGAGLLTSGGDWKKALLGAGIGGGAAALGPLIGNALSGTSIGDFLGARGGQNSIFGNYPQGAMQSQYFGGMGPGGGDTGSRMDAYANDPAFQSSASTTGNLARGASGLTTSGGGSGSGGTSSLLKYALPAVTLLGLLSGNKGQSSGAPPAAAPTSGGGGMLPKLTLDMHPKDVSDVDWWTFGQRPKKSTTFFDSQWKNADGTPMAAAGGYVPGYAPGGPVAQPPMRGGALGSVAGPPAGGRYVGPGPGSGRDDQIPARLSPNEYVMDASTVADLGDGSPDEGARRLDRMRINLRKHKGSAMAKGRQSPAAKLPHQYLGR